MAHNIFNIHAMNHVNDIEENCLSQKTKDMDTMAPMLNLCYGFTATTKLVKPELSQRIQELEAQFPGEFENKIRSSYCLCIFIIFSVCIFFFQGEVNQGTEKNR